MVTASRNVICQDLSTGFYKLCLCLYLIPHNQALQASLVIPIRKDLRGLPWKHPVMISSVQSSCLVVSNSLQPHRLQHARPLCPSPTPGVYSNSCPLSRWCHPTISSSVVPFSSRLQSFPASGSFQVLLSQFLASGGQRIGVSAST